MKNKYEIKGNTTEIYVQSPKYGLKIILIDTEDLELVCRHSWLVCKHNNSFYCRSTSKQYIQLHRLIVKPKEVQVVDHINHNTLDNRKENLRICTNKENLRNQKTHKNNTSGFRGVDLHTQRYKNKKYKHWRSKIMYNNKAIYLGSFPYTEEGKIQAAIRYDKEAIKLFDKFALLNFTNKKNYKK